MGDILPQITIVIPNMETLHSSILGGSWVVIIGVVRPPIWVITKVILLITLLITTHEPPSMGTLDPLGIP